MTRTFKFKSGALVQVVEGRTDTYDSRTRAYGGYKPCGVSTKIWPFKIPGMIVSLNFRYPGDPYPEYRVLVGDQYFDGVPTRYIKLLNSTEN